MPGHNVGRGMESLGKSKKSKAPKGGPRGRNLRRTQRFKDTEEGKAAIERGLRRSLAREGESDVSKYDDRLAAAIRDVDFRNSPIGRSLLADEFQSGDLTAREFQELQGLRTDPRQSLESRRQLNTALGLNPTSGMTLSESLRSGFEGEQFKQDRRRLGQLLSLAPLRQGIVQLLGGEIDRPRTTAEQLGLTAAEDAELRTLSNPEIVSRLLPDFEDDETTEDSLIEDLSPEQIITTPDPLEDLSLDTLSMRGMVNLPAINARINAALRPNINTTPRITSTPKLTSTPRLAFNPRLNLGMFNLNPNTGGVTNILTQPRGTAGSIFQNPNVLNTRLSSIAPVGGATKTTAVAPFQTRSLTADLNKIPLFRRTLPGMAMTALGIASMMGDQGQPMVGTGGTEDAPNNLTGIIGDVFDPESELNQRPFMDFLFN